MLLARPATVYATGAKTCGPVLTLDVFEGVQEGRAELMAIVSFPGALDQVIVANPGGSHARKRPTTCVMGSVQREGSRLRLHAAGSPGT